MSGRARWAGVAHDLALGWMTGGIAGAGMSAVVLFWLAPSREVAGQIGNVIFSLLGRSILFLTIVLLASRLLLRSGGARVLGPADRHAHRPAIWPAVLACLLAALLALWITPVMTGIWRTALHDPAGAGLTGADKARFMRLHGVGNLIYLGLFGLGSLMIAARAMAGARSGGSAAEAGRGAAGPAMERSGGTGSPGQPARP